MLPSPDDYRDWKEFARALIGVLNDSGVDPSAPLRGTRIVTAELPPLPEGFHPVWYSPDQAAMFLANPLYDPPTAPDLFQIDTAQLAEAAIVTSKIRDDAINTQKIIDGAASTLKIGLSAIDSARVQLGAVTTTKLADLAVITSKVLDATMSTSKIADFAVIDAKIVDAAIINAKIAEAAIGSANIQDANVIGAKILDAAIVSAKIGDAAIQSVDIGAAQIIAATIADANVLGAKILDAAIVTAKVADAAIVSALIGNAQIVEAKIANLAVNTANIANAAINSAKIANLSVGAAHIIDASINNAHITGAITSNDWNATTKVGWSLDKAGGFQGRNISIYDASGNLVFGAGTSYQLAAERIIGDIDFSQIVGDIDFARIVGDIDFARIIGDIEFARITGDIDFARIVGTTRPADNAGTSLALLESATHSVEGNTVGRLGLGWVTDGSEVYSRESYAAATAEGIFEPGTTEMLFGLSSHSGAAGLIAYAKANYCWYKDPSNVVYALTHPGFTPSSSTHANTGPLVPGAVYTVTTDGETVYWWRDNTLITTVVSEFPTSAPHPQMRLIATGAGAGGQIVGLQFMPYNAITRIGRNLLGQMSAANISTFIAGAAIGTALIQNAAITNALIGNLAVGSAQIQSLAVGSAQIQALAIGSAHIAAASINTAHISSLSASVITTGLLQNAGGTVTLNVATGTQTVIAGSYRHMQGSGFGTGSNLIEWWGLNSVTVGSETIANSIWARATDGGVYYGGAELGGGGETRNFIDIAISSSSAGLTEVVCGRFVATGGTLTIDGSAPYINDRSVSSTLAFYLRKPDNSEVLVETQTLGANDADDMAILYSAGTGLGSNVEVWSLVAKLTNNGGSSDTTSAAGTVIWILE